MVDNKTDTKPEKTENKEAVNPREAIHERRRARLRLIKGQGAPATIKVYAASEDIAEFVRHYPSGARFRDDGSAEWPNDGFTQRRIAEGAVLTDGPAQQHPEAMFDETLNPRQQAVARAGGREIVGRIKDSTGETLPVSASKSKPSSPAA
jgi:hypothetical protein